MRLVSITLAVTTLSACGFGFENRSEVIDRRVLAIRVEPPEVIADGSPLPQTVTISALVVDPASGVTPVSYAFRSCTSAVAGGAEGAASPNKGQPDPVTGRCDAADDDTLVTRGERPLSELSLLEVAMPVPPSLGPALQVAAARGFPVSVYVQAQLEVGAGPDALVAFKRFVVSPPLPAGRQANRNPRLAALFFDDALWPADRPLEIRRNTCLDEDRSTIPDPDDDMQEIKVCGHRITPAYDADQSEPYAVQQFDGQRLELRERLRFDWYVDKGSFSDQRTSEPAEIGPPKKRDPVTTKWYEPKTAQPLVTLWVVVRDGRGGEAWETRTLKLVD
jgi:hypothetical protein